MGLYKEVDYWFAERAKKQVQIYPDACDTGLPVESHTSHVAQEFTHLFNPKTKEHQRDHDFLFGELKLHRSTFKNGQLHGSEISLYLPWEMGDEGYSICTKWTIRYTDDKQRKVRFISLETNRVEVEDHKVWK